MDNRPAPSPEDRAVISHLVFKCLTCGGGIVQQPNGTRDPHTCGESPHPQWAVTAEHAQDGPASDKGIPDAIGKAIGVVVGLTLLCLTVVLCFVALRWAVGLL